MNLALFAAAYALFHATHKVADYWLQTDWMAQNKSKGGPLWGWVNPALSIHLAVYAISFTPALLLLQRFGGITSSEVAIAFWAIYLPHGWMDRRRFLTWFCEETKGWRSDNLVDLPITPERLSEAFFGHVKTFVVDSEQNLQTLGLPQMTVKNASVMAYVRKTDSLYTKNLDLPGWIKLPNNEFTSFVRTRDLTPLEAAIRTHVFIEMDQSFHYLSLLLVALWLAM